MRPLLKASAVAEILGVNVEWVRRRTRAGAIPHIRFGRAIRYRPEDVETYLAERVL